MGEFLDSLGLGSGAILIAVISSLFALVTARLRPPLLRWIAAFALPLPLAYCCYWAPVWLGGSSDQRSSWEPIFVVPWWLAGFLSAGLTTIIVSRHAKRNA